MSKRDKLNQIIELLQPSGHSCRMLIPDGDWFTDLVETKPLKIWQREYKTIIVAKPEMHGLIYLFNFDPPGEALELMAKQDLTEEEEKKLSRLLDETVKNNPAE